MPWPIQAFRTLSETIIGMPDECKIERLVWSEDSEGRPIQVPSVIETTKCRLQGLSGTEVQQSGRLAPDSTLTAFLPFGTDLEHEDRLVIEGVRYDVQYVMEGSPAFQAHVKAFLTSTTAQD